MTTNGPLLFNAETYLLMLQRSVSTNTIIITSQKQAKSMVSHLALGLSLQHVPNISTFQASWLFAGEGGGLACD